MKRFASFLIVLFIVISTSTSLALPNEVPNSVEEEGIWCQYCEATESQQKYTCSMLESSRSSAQCMYAGNCDTQNVYFITIKYCTKCGHRASFSIHPEYLFHSLCRGVHGIDGTGFYWLCTYPY